MSEKIMETLKTIHAKKMADVFSRIYTINQLENFTFINYSKIGNIIEEVTKRFVISEYNDGVKDRQIFIYLNDSDIDKNKVNCAVCIYHFTCDEDDKKDINVDDVTFLTYDKNDNISITVYDNDFDLVCDRYVIDAKSIMGIFSLDLSQNLKLNIQKDTDVDAILADIDEFIVK